MLNSPSNLLRILGASAAILALLFSASNAAAQTKEKDQGWDLFRGDAGSSGVAHTTLPAKPEVVWKHKVKDGSFESTPVIIAPKERAPMVVIGDLDGKVIALDLKSGKLLWELELGELGFTAAAAYHDGKIFIGDFDGFFYCLDLDGKLIWKYTTESEINGSANFYKDLVLFGAQDGGLYAIERESGKLSWKYQADDQIQCSTTVAANRAFLAGCDGKLHVVDLESGKRVAQVEIESPTGNDSGHAGRSRLLWDSARNVSGGRLERSENCLAARRSTWWDDDRRFGGRERSAGSLSGAKSTSDFTRAQQRERTMGYAVEKQSGCLARDRG